MKKNFHKLSFIVLISILTFVFSSFSSFAKVVIINDTTEYIINPISSKLFTFASDESLNDNISHTFEGKLDSSVADYDIQYVTSSGLILLHIRFDGQPGTNTDIITRFNCGANTVTNICSSGCEGNEFNNFNKFMVLFDTTSANVYIDGSNVGGASLCQNNSNIKKINITGSVSQSRVKNNLVTKNEVQLAVCGNNIVESGEQCDGGACCDPSCQFESSSLVCRASAGVCDAAETCTGTDANCPSDAFASSATVCRAAASVCDAAETCTGSSVSCPADSYALLSTVCPTAPPNAANHCDGAGNCVCNPTGTSESVCNGVDDNCDGLIDEGFVSTNTSCGTGLCASTGTTSCVNGVVTDSCTPGTPSAEVCDGLDNNCDSIADESGNALCDDALFCNGQETCSGISGCQAGTTVVCYDGNACTMDSCNETTNSCDFIASPGTDEICDGLDNNCNGNVDEGCPAVYKENALTLLQSLSPSNSKSAKYLNEAINGLIKSLGNRIVGGDKRILWLDAGHVACKHGHKVFDYEKKAVHYLEEINNPAISASVNQAITVIVNADRNLSKTAIDEAPSGKDKDKAIEKFNKGEAIEKNKNKIQNYREAWKYINKHCKKDDDEDDDD